MIRIWFRKRQRRVVHVVEQYNAEMTSMLKHGGSWDDLRKRHDRFMEEWRRANG